ncbi:MAG TPA: DUF6317 family protein [Pseudonocardiaceae bacterium]|jgi:hypothetical protein|nr:DUF6317 family protein [Pseudonocardiaceae bacterium]
MSSGYQVVLGDLADASSTFERESKTFANVMPDDGAPPVDGGDPAFNDTLSVVLQAIGGLHLGIAGAIEGHGEKLHTAHDNYTKVEVSVRELYDDILSPDSIKPLK